MDIHCECKTCGLIRPFNDMGQVEINGHTFFFCHPATSVGETCYSLMVTNWVFEDRL